MISHNTRPGAAHANKGGFLLGGCLGAEVERTWVEATPIKLQSGKTAQHVGGIIFSFLKVWTEKGLTLLNYT